MRKIKGKMNIKPINKEVIDEATAIGHIFNSYDIGVDLLAHKGSIYEIQKYLFIKNGFSIPAHSAHVERVGYDVKINDFIDNDQLDEDIIKEMPSIGYPFFSSVLGGIAGLRQSFLFLMDCVESLANNTILINKRGWKHDNDLELNYLIDYNYTKGFALVVLKQFFTYHNSLKEALFNIESIKPKKIEYLEILREVGIPLTVINNINFRHQTFDPTVVSTVREYKDELTIFIHTMYKREEDIVKHLNDTIIYEGGIK